MVYTLISLILNDIYIYALRRCLRLVDFYDMKIYFYVENMCSVYSLKCISKDNIHIWTESPHVLKFISICNVNQNVLTKHVKISSKHNTISKTEWSNK